MRGKIAAALAGIAGAGFWLACVGDEPGTGASSASSSGASTSSGSTVQQGANGGPCFPDHTCTPGLVCGPNAICGPPGNVEGGPGDGGMEAAPFVCPSGPPSSDLQTQCPEVPTPPTTCGGNGGCCPIEKKCEEPKADFCTTGEAMWQCDGPSGCASPGPMRYCCVPGATRVTAGGACNGSTIEINGASAACATDCAGKVELCSTSQPCSQADAGGATCQALVVHRNGNLIKLGVCVLPDGGF